MKKLLTFSFLILTFFISFSLMGNEQDLPELITAQSAEQETIDWRWRISSENKFYPYLKINSNQLFFLNPTGEILIQKTYLPNSKVITSENQSFVAFLEPIRQKNAHENLKTKNSFQYHITDFWGQEIYSIPIEVQYDDPIPAIYLANNGRSVIIDGFRGIVHIVNKDATLGQEIDLFNDDVLDYEKPISCAVATAEEKFAILAQKRPSSFDESSSTFISGQPYVFYFSLDGEEIWRKPLDLITASELAISPSGKFVVVSQYSPEDERKTSVFDLNGETVMEIPTLFGYAGFSNDESWLFLADKKKLFTLDLQKKSHSITTVIPKAKNRMIVDLKIAYPRNESLVLTAKSTFQKGRFEFIEPELIKINVKGEQLWGLNFWNEKFIRPSLQYYQDHIAIGFESNYKIYREQRD